MLSTKLSKLLIKFCWPTKTSNTKSTFSDRGVNELNNFTVCKKHQLVAAYRSYTKIFKLPWEPVKVNYTPRKPFVPLEAELDQLIAASGKRTAAFLQTLKDTGCKVWKIMQAENKRHR